MNNKAKWTVLTLGYFTRNKYWGEDENGKPNRSAFCTSTLIEKNGKYIVVDPPAAGDIMAAILDQRSGLKPQSIDYVFVTHCHYDHYVGLEAFPNAELFLAPDEYDLFYKAISNPEPGYPLSFDDGEALAKRLRPAGNEIISGIKTVSLPGHTMGLTGLMFESAEGVILIAGDSVMTQDHFKDRHGYFCEDYEMSKTTMDKINTLADIVVPGHSNFFLLPSLTKSCGS